jgi:hypothetical protein
MTATDTLVTAAKLRIRKTTNDILDDDIVQLVNFALCDLKRIGVCQGWIDNPDGLLIEAVLTYVKANFGVSADEKLMNSYNIILTKIKGGNYKNYSQQGD